MVHPTRPLLAGNWKGRKGRVVDREFEETALPFLDDVSRFALYLTREESESDDLVQETFLRAFRGWHTYRAGTDCRKWLFKICRNAFVRRLRKRDRLVLSEEGDVDSMPTVRSHLAADQEGLGNLFDQIDVRPAITRTLNSLPEPHHSVLVLVDLEGLRYDEAAEVLGVPVGTVRSRLYRARRMVQESLIDHARDMGLGRTGRVTTAGDGGGT